jgi:signal transduction histidine kinase/ligand-binding sensor domain-containing protein
MFGPGHDSMTRSCLRRSTWLAVCLVIFAHASVHADSNRYGVTSWVEADGVPLGTVHVISQSPDGYLWIGADAGLFRFDGLRFTSWSAFSDAPLPNAPVSALLISRDGSLWVGLADGSGVRHIRGEALVENGDISNLAGTVTDLIEDGDRTIWAISDNALYRLERTGWKRLSLPWIDRPSLVLHLYVTAKGRLRVATAQGLFGRQADDTFELLSTGYVWDVSESRDGTVWITDIATGFRELREISRSRSRGKVEGGGYRLLRDRRENLWVGTLGEGLWRVRTPDAATPLAAIPPPQRIALPSNTVQSIHEDRNANIWVGTTVGLHRVHERPVKPVENVGFVISVSAGDGPTMWAGTTDGLVDASAPVPLKLPTGTRPIVLVLHRDTRGTVWMGTTAGLWRVEGRTPVPVSLPPGLVRRAITLLSSHGKMLFLGDGEDLYRWDGSTLMKLTAPARAGFTRVTFVQAARDGRIWIASAGGQLGYFDPDGGVRTLGPHDGLTDGTHVSITSMVEDAEAFWIAGSGGLSRFSDGRIVTVTRAHGLPGNRVASVMADGQGYLWLSVDRGIVRLHRDEVTRALEGSSYRMRYMLFDTSDGLAGAPLGSIRSAQGRDGRLWFVRGGGLSVIDPSTVRGDSSPSAPVQIEAVAANERRLLADKRTALPPGTKRLQISYTALALSPSDNLRFRYRLDGFDTDWIEAGSRRSAFYTNLAPGRYLFRVEAHSDDGTWRSSGATWDFTIEPAFYQTNAFYAFGALVPLLIGWAAWRLRLRLVRRRFSLVIAERSRLSREIHDTLLQSLVAVALEIDAVSRIVERSAAGAKRELQRIRRQVEMHIREVRQSIWHLRSPMLESQDLCTVLRDFGTRLAADQPTRFIATVSGTPRQCGARFERQVLRIGQEAIINAIRHAEAATVHLELRFDNDAVMLRVSDDGRGFVPHEVSGSLDGHYGLTTMRERAEEIGGRFDLRTAVGHGTVIEAVLPLQVDGDFIPAAALGRDTRPPSDDDSNTPSRRGPGLTPPASA